MHVIKPGTKGGVYGHVSTSRGVGDFGISVFHRPGCDRPATSPLKSSPRQRRAHTADPPLASCFGSSQLHHDCCHGSRLTPSGLVARRCQGALRPGGNSAQFQLRNSTAKGKVSGMTSKSKRNETLELHARPAQPHAEDAAANHEPNPDEIRRRAYEIYLESSGLPGRELDE